MCNSFSTSLQCTETTSPLEEGRRVFFSLEVDVFLHYVPFDELSMDLKDFFANQADRRLNFCISLVLMFFSTRVILINFVFPFLYEYRLIHCLLQAPFALWLHVCVCNTLHAFWLEAMGKVRSDIIGFFC